MCEIITKSYIDTELLALLHWAFWLPSVHIVCVWRQLEIHSVANKLGGVSREDKQYQGFSKDCEPACRLSHTQDKWLTMKQPLNQGFFHRLTKGWYILTGAILSAFPSQFGINTPKTAQEKAAKKKKKKANPLLKQNLFKLYVQKK